MTSKWSYWDVVFNENYSNPKLLYFVINRRHFWNIKLF